MKKKPCSIEPVSSVCKTTIKRNKTMKNKLAIASAFLAASSFSMGEIVINDSLSFQGYVDSSYRHTEYTDGDNSESFTEDFQIDKVEISWLFDFEAVTAQVDLEYDGVSSDITAQQAFVNYALSGGSVVTVGRYVSMLGFEAKKPTGLFQSSTAYSIAGDDLSRALDFNTRYGGVDGVKYTVASDTTFFGISVSKPNVIGDTDRDIVEVAASLDLGGGFSVFVGGSFSENDELRYEHYNAYVTYETGAWLFAAELNATGGDGGGGDVVSIHSGLLMANYEYSDIASVTARFSAVDWEDRAEYTKYTLAHNYDFSDSLLLVTEVTHLDSTGSTSLTEYAVKLLFSF